MKLYKKWKYIWNIVSKMKIKLFFAVFQGAQFNGKFGNRNRP